MPISVAAVLVVGGGLFAWLAPRLFSLLAGTVSKWWETRIARRVGFNASHLKPVEEYLSRSFALHEHIQIELGKWGMDELMDQSQVDAVRARTRDMLDLDGPIQDARNAARLVNDDQLVERLKESGHMNAEAIRYILESAREGQSARPCAERLQAARLADDRLARRVRQLQL